MTFKKLLRLLCLILLVCATACLGAACGVQPDADILYYTGLPSDTDTMKWQVSEETEIPYQGGRYDVLRLTATGVLPDSPLVTLTENEAVAVPDSGEYTVTLCSGDLQASFAEPFPAAAHSMDSESMYATHLCNMTLAFLYVKESGQGEDAYRLSYCTNAISVELLLNGAGVTESTPETWSWKQTAGLCAPGFYDAAQSAIEAYLGSDRTENRLEAYTLRVGAQDTQAVSLPCFSDPTKIA